MAVPIGNSKDVSLRVLERLEEVEIILCEDTRKTAKLLSKESLKNLQKMKLLLRHLLSLQYK